MSPEEFSESKSSPAAKADGKDQAKKADKTKKPVAVAIKDLTTANQVSAVIDGLADPIRLRLAYALYQKPANVTQLTKALKIKQPSVSHHLRLLTSAAISERERDGKNVVYSLRKDCPVSFKGGILTIKIR